MARFVYRMQNILNLKRKTEDQAKMDLGFAQQRYNTEEDKLNALIDRKTQYLEDSRRMQSDIIPVQDVIQNRLFLQVMDDEIAGQRLVLIRMEEALDAARERMRIAMQERKMQERLRERAFEQYLEEEKAAEAVESDQRTSFTYGQRIREQKSSTT